MGKNKFNSVGWCLEEIQIIAAKFPNEIESEENKTLANNVVLAIEKVSNILQLIVENENFKKVLGRLEKQISFEEIKFQAEHIEKLFDDLRHMLDFLNTRYIPNLKNILLGVSKDSWHNAASDITEMIIKDFGNEYYDLKEEFKIVLHTEEELLNLLKNHLPNSSHLEEELKNFLIYEKYLENVLK